MAEAPNRLTSSTNPIGSASSLHDSKPMGCQEASANPTARETSRTTASIQRRSSRAANRSSGTGDEFSAGGTLRGSLEARDKSGEAGSNGIERPASASAERWLVRIGIEFL